MSRLERILFREEGKGEGSAWKYVETSVKWVRQIQPIMLDTARAVLTQQDLWTVWIQLEANVTVGQWPSLLAAKNAQCEQIM